MAWLMNDADGDKLLADACPAGESYTAAAWGTLLGSAARLLALGAASNTYCYVGLTGHSLVLAAVNPMDISRASGRLVVPLDTAERIRVSRGLLPGRYIVRLRTANAALRLCLTEGGLARVSGQRQAVRQICSALQSLAGPGALPRAKPTCAQS